MFVAFKYGSMEAQVTGFISGLGMDIFSIHLFGVNAFTKTIVGFFAGLFRKRIYSENAMVIIIYIFIGSFFNGIIFALSNLIFKTGAISFWNYIYGTLIIEMLYNCVIGVPLFFLFEKSDKAFRRE
jgi:rod shape-determining protein MreD